MTSALAAAKRELDRSRERLEQEMSRNPDYAALRSLERSPDAHAPASIQQRQILVGRLEALPLFQALQAIIAANAHIAATVKARKTRQSSPAPDLSQTPCLILPRPEPLQPEPLLPDRDPSLRRQIGQRSH